MSTISFKTDDNFKDLLKLLAQKKGINTSAYIKLVLTKGVNDELSEITENGLTLKEEIEILKADKDTEVHGPYKSSKSLMKALKS